MVHCLCPAEPPESVKSKGARGAAMNIMLAKKDEPHQFALGLQDACCAEPCCCLLSGMGAPFGCTACWARSAVLEKYGNGIADYVCCQGYVPACCCCDMGEQCKGSQLGLVCEGLCCPVFSISIARIHLMDKKRIRPDPCDYQLIQCSNCLQLISCILDIVAIFVEQARDLAHVVDSVADAVTCAGAGCMGAQIKHEIKKDKDGIVFVVVEGVPVMDGQAAIGAPPGSLAAQDEMGGSTQPAMYPTAVAVPVATPVNPSGGGGAPPNAEEMCR